MRSMRSKVAVASSRRRAELNIRIHRIGSRRIPALVEPARRDAREDDAALAGGAAPLDGECRRRLAQIGQRFGAAVDELGLARAGADPDQSGVSRIVFGGDDGDGAALARGLDGEAPGECGVDEVAFTDRDAEHRERRRGGRAGPRRPAARCGSGGLARGSGRRGRCGRAGPDWSGRSAARRRDGRLRR